MRSQLQTSHWERLFSGQPHVFTMIGRPLADRLTPTAVEGGLRYTAMDAGLRHTCGRASDGSLYCWGSGAAGQLGTNSRSHMSVPSKVVGQP